VATVDIRSASDAELAALVAAFGQDHFFRDRLERQRQGRGDLLVAWSGSEPVGDVYLHRELPDEAAVREHLGYTPTLSHLEVRVGRQGQGIGSAMIAEAERTPGARLSPGASASESTTPARRLYERLGFQEWEHGLVAVEWDEPDGSGGSRRESIVCHWLIKDLSLASRPGIDEWRAFEPAEAAALLRRSGLDDVPWYVAGGWAVDLHLGGSPASTRTSRRHPRTCFDRWRAALTPSPSTTRGRAVASASTTRPRDPANHQVWLCADGAWRMDTFLESGDATTWVCHRDARVRAPLADAVARSREGLPYLRPQFVLLGKAKHRRPKDEADLAALLPTMDVAARRWLARALQLVHPGHPWIGRALAPGSSP
jgi:GNAT superfamily N-acetyltransferase